MNWLESIPDGIVQPMYGVPIVKYGPPPSPTPWVPGSIDLPFRPGFDWGSLWNSPWQQPSFVLPDFGHFPKLIGALALAALIALSLAALCGWTLRGGVWYLKSKK